MKVLILGGCGMLGPWVVKALKHRHDIILTDINPPGDEFDGDFRQVSSDDLDGVVATAEGCDAIINLSVLREDRKLAFDVSTRGNYNMMAGRPRRTRHRARHQHRTALPTSGRDV